MSKIKLEILYLHPYSDSPTYLSESEELLYLSSEQKG